MPEVAVQTISFPDPAHFEATPTYELLIAAARGYVGIDQRFIRAILSRGTAAVSELVRYGTEDHSAEPVDLEEDLISIFHDLHSPEALPFYIECLRRQPEDVTDELLEAFLNLGAVALDPLLKLYEEIGEENGGDVAFLLASLRIHDERVYKLLLERLEYDAGDGAFCLGLYGDPAAKPALEKLLTGIPAEDGELRREVTFALEQLDAPSPEPEPKHENSDIWELYPEKSSPQVDLLSDEAKLEMLNAASAEYRAEAAGSYRNKELPLPIRSRLIQLAKGDPDSVVRARCWEGLSSAVEEPEIRKALLAAVNNEQAPIEERSGALVGLAQISENPQVDKRMREFYEIPEARSKAMEAMWRSLNRGFASYFPKHLDDADLDIRRQAIWGVGYLGISAEAGKLKKFFNEEEFRPDALFAFALSTPAEISRGRMPALFRKIEELAEGLSQGEAELVELALDERLAFHGLEPIFSQEGDEDEEEEEPSKTITPSAPPGRNDACPCGSGKKFKKCHGA